MTDDFSPSHPGPAGPNGRVNELEEDFEEFKDNFSRRLDNIENDKRKEDYLADLDINEINADEDFRADEIKKEVHRDILESISLPISGVSLLMAIQMAVYHNLIFSIPFIATSMYFFNVWSNLSNTKEWKDKIFNK